MGQFVNRGSTIAMIYATDLSEVRLPINDEELAFIDLSLSADGITGTNELIGATSVDIVRADILEDVTISSPDL